MIIEPTKRRRGIAAFLLSLVIFSGCANPLTKISSKLTSAKGAKVEQAGAVEIPAKQSSEETVTEIPLAANSQVSIVTATEYKPSELRVTFAAPAMLKHTQTREQATAAKTIAPPTAKEQAAADGLKWFYIAGAVMLVAASALLYFGHGKASGLAFLGAFLAPTLGQLVGSVFALVAVAILGAASLALFVAWFLIQSKVKNSASTTPLAHE